MVPVEAPKKRGRKPKVKVIDKRTVKKQGLLFGTAGAKEQPVVIRFR